MPLIRWYFRIKMTIFARLRKWPHAALQGAWWFSGRRLLISQHIIKRISLPRPYFTCFSMRLRTASSPGIHMRAIADGISAEAWPARCCFIFSRPSSAARAPIPRRKTMRRGSRRPWPIASRRASFFGKYYTARWLRVLGPHSFRRSTLSSRRDGRAPDGCKDWWTSMRMATLHGMPPRYSRAGAAGAYGGAFRRIDAPLAIKARRRCVGGIVIPSRMPSITRCHGQGWTPCKHDSPQHADYCQRPIMMCRLPDSYIYTLIFLDWALSPISLFRQCLRLCRKPPLISNFCPDK